jgi:hypothetical protein
MADEINTPGKLFSSSPDMWSVVENLTNDDNINLCRPFPLWRLNMPFMQGCG